MIEIKIKNYQLRVTEDVNYDVFSNKRNPFIFQVETSFGKDSMNFPIWKKEEKVECEALFLILDRLRDNPELLKQV